MVEPQSYGVVQLHAFCDQCNSIIRISTRMRGMRRRRKTLTQSIDRAQNETNTWRQHPRMSIEVTDLAHRRLQVQSLWVLRDRCSLVAQDQDQHHDNIEDHHHFTDAVSEASQSSSSVHLCDVLDSLQPSDGGDQDDVGPVEEKFRNADEWDMMIRRESSGTSDARLVSHVFSATSVDLRQGLLLPSSGSEHTAVGGRSQSSTFGVNYPKMNPVVNASFVDDQALFLANKSDIADFSQILKSREEVAEEDHRDRRKGKDNDFRQDDHQVNKEHDLMPASSSSSSMPGGANGNAMLMPEQKSVFPDAMSPVTNRNEAVVPNGNNEAATFFTRGGLNESGFLTSNQGGDISLAAYLPSSNTNSLAGPPAGVGVGRDHDSSAGPGGPNQNSVLDALSKDLVGRSSKREGGRRRFFDQDVEMQEENSPNYTVEGMNHPSSSSASSAFEHVGNDVAVRDEAGGGLGKATTSRRCQVPAGKTSSDGTSHIRTSSSDPTGTLPNSVLVDTRRVKKPYAHDWDIQGRRHCFRIFETGEVKISTTSHSFYISPGGVRCRLETMSAGEKKRGGADGSEATTPEKDNTSEATPPPSRATSIRQFESKALPVALKKWYELAFNVVNSLRAETPKVVLHYDGFRCELRDNVPIPDFVIFFNALAFEGTAVRRCRVKDGCLVVLETGLEVEGASAGGGFGQMEVEGLEDERHAARKQTTQGRGTSFELPLDLVLADDGQTKQDELDRLLLPYQWELGDVRRVLSALRKGLFAALEEERDAVARARGLLVDLRSSCESPKIRDALPGRTNTETKILSEVYDFDAAYAAYKLRLDNLFPVVKRMNETA
eukprot:GSA25T00008492001.1